MEGFGKEYYQQMIQTDTHASQWTQFEMDLIRCIRDEYPVIYTKMGEMNRHQRAAKIRGAWKQISNKFSEIPMTYIKARWRSILDNYLKLKIYADSTSGFNEDLVKNKFMDGTLSFLEGEVDLFFDSHKVKKIKTSHHPDEEQSDDENDEVDTKSYEMNIKELLHEEIDLDDDDGMAKVKKENDDSNYGNSNETDKGNTLPDNNIEESRDELKHTWSEEELMNATRLTKDMIDQLILIKTRHYYMAPLVDN